MPNRIQLRRGNELDWQTINPLIAEGELCAELDTGRYKIGDGIHHWNDLQYSSGTTGTTGTAATITIGTVTTGTDAAFVNIGDEHNAVFDITLPIGPQGPKGDIGTQINKVIDIPDVYTGGVGHPNLTTGSMLIYNNGAMRWETELKNQDIDGGEF